MTHTVAPFTPDRRPGVVLARGCGWGAVAGGFGGAAFVTPVVVANGPVVALLVYPAFAAPPGAVVGVVVGPLVGAGLLASRPVTTAGARAIAAFTTALCVAWIPLVAGGVGAALWLLAVAVVAGALVGPAISARPSGAAAAAGRASPGSSRAPGR